MKERERKRERECLVADLDAWHWSYMIVAWRHNHSYYGVGNIVSMASLMYTLNTRKTDLEPKLKK